MFRRSFHVLLQPKRFSSHYPNSLLDKSRECFLEKLNGPETGIAILNLNRPAAKNALGKQFMEEFRQTLEAIRFDDQIRVLILRSLVDRVFCAGADLKERASMNPSEVSAFVASLRNAFLNLETLPMPTISVIDGAALGGGLELALATDLRVAGPKAKLGLPETKLAIIPGAGGTQRLPRLIGLSKAKELVFTASVLDSQQGLKIGLINHVSEDETTGAFGKAIQIAKTILPQGPVAIRMAKLAMDRGIQLDLSSGLAFEQTCYAQVIPTQDRLEGLKAFKEKRQPVYKGE